MYVGKCVILSRVSMQFPASSAMNALAMTTAAQRKNCKQTAANKRLVHPHLIDAWGSGARKMVRYWLPTLAAIKHCVKLPRMPNAKRINVLWAAVTVTCATQPPLFPSACSWWPFALPLAWPYWSKTAVRTVRSSGRVWCPCYVFFDNLFSSHRLV